MATYSIYKLTFTSPLHLSRGKENTYESSDTILHSDTLKSAIYAVALQVGLQDWANEFMQHTRISSAFPFQGESLFLPMPLSYRPDVAADDRKAFKKVKYLTINQFEAIAKGEKPELLNAERKATEIDIWKRDVTQRVKINYEADSEPFYLEKLYPKADCGLYFIVADDCNFTIFEKALTLLADNGIGLQRNLGNGRFEWQKDTLEIALTAGSNAYMNLSLYRPNESDFTDADLEKSIYQFKKRGGWISSPEMEQNISLRKKSVMMFTEGSVFSFENVKNKGVVENVKPNISAIEHEIWRDGKAIFLPISI